MSEFGWVFEAVAEECSRGEATFMLDGELLKRAILELVAEHTADPVGSEKGLEPRGDCS